MGDLTLVQCYYDQPKLVTRWWDAIRTWPKELADKVSILWVDDGSPTHPLRLPDDIKADWRPRLFRVKQDILWNEMGARNLAMKQASGWVLCLDADYTLPAESLQHVLSPAFRPQRRHLYFPPARRFGKTEHLHHPVNLFFIHAEDFWQANGYDEAFAGGYGLSDTDLLRTLSMGFHVKMRKLQNVWIDHYQIDQEPDAYVHWKDRSLARNSALFKSKIAAMQKHGIKRIIAQNKHLQFDWEEIK